MAATYLGILQGASGALLAVFVDGGQTAPSEDADALVASNRARVYA